MVSSYSNARSPPNGRGRAWINGSPVTASVLAGIGRTLVNLHGQHEAQTLLDGESQRRMLDAFGGATTVASLWYVKPTKRWPPSANR